MDVCYVCWMCGCGFDLCSLTFGLGVQTLSAEALSHTARDDCVMEISS